MATSDWTTTSSSSGLNNSSSSNFLNSGDTTTMVGPSQHHVNNGDLGGSGSGVGTLSPIEGSRSPKDSSGGANMMSTSSIFDSPGDDTPSRPSRRQYTNRNRNDPQALALQREREERVRRLREQQEDERKKKLEELRQHAISAQKFREQQEMERRRHLDELRYRDEDKRSQVEERRRAIESAERERREALLKKNQEREERIETKRRQQSGQMNFAFGSSTPRILGPRHDSSADIWGGGARRSTSSSNVNNQMTQSLYSRRSSERDQPDFNHSVSVVNNNNRTTKRATSAHGLNQSGEGLSVHHQRSPSAVSTEGGAATPTSSAGVRMRASAGPRRPRPISIATTGVMSSSMYEKGSKAAGSGALTPGSRPSALKLMKREEDTLSVGSNTSSSQTKPRKTPNQVKKESEAKKQAKKSPSSATPPQFPSSPVKTSSRSTPTSSSVVAPSTATTAMSEMDKNVASETSNDENVAENVGAASEKRELTPDLISSSPVKETSTVEIIVNDESVENEGEGKEEQNEKEEVLVQVERSPSREMTPAEDKKEEMATNGEAENESDQLNSSGKKVISSAEEAKARLAEKRREVKEKKEREAEIERQRLLAIEREEEERLRREEEEERRAQEEADRLAEEARRLEEDRLRKAIEEQERKGKEQREREEQMRREKEESERRAKEEAEKKRVELEEKLRREEEERMARKKRIEEIMARTRGAKTPAATPQSPSKTNDIVEPVVVKNNDSEEVVARTESPKSVDPTKPDLLGDIGESVKMSGDGYIESSLDDVEKGEIDMKISAKNEDARMNQKNSTKLLDLSEFDGLSYRQPDAKAALGSGDNNGHDNDVDQILDLSSANGRHTDSDNEAEDRPTPIIAFEENRMTSPKQEVSTADLLS